ncbi:MAG TPA: helix-turn-helix domain-containing protein [Ornithinimicrobium sp.]|uniref:helix-turn-helix transcriptional regulator n=1 Tax=Ornithinimicrobium sp. TaxID=1977084 RepID=UPI002B4A31B6|nr:helix-turn-helix domain-containing protein [Ornithinimicrobium sp.]HKJ10756.1 helix-turn-helix domain-containing protein [Ornithinimicrobium sp.]
MEQTQPTQLSARRQYESLSQAAERTGLSTRTLRRRIAAGDLRAYRSGPRIIRVDPRDVDDLLVPLRTVQTYPN